LGDHVVVLSRGKVQAQGSSLDLKNRFGVGYHLHVVKVRDEDNAFSFDSEAVLDLLCSHISETSSVSILTDVGAECSFALPRETDKFPALFEELEARREELKIEQLALSMTTLEEVFLQLGKEEEEADRLAEEKETKEVP
jgi:ABC-type multidrug transport system ATPase subunit